MGDRPDRPHLDRRLPALAQPLPDRLMVRSALTSAAALQPHQFFPRISFMGSEHWLRDEDDGRS